MRLAFAALSSLALLAAPTLGAQPPAPLLVLRMPAGTRALALGGAAVAVTDAEAVFNNPAQLTNGRGVAIGAQRWGAGASLVSAAVAIAASPGGLGFGVQHLDYTTTCDACAGEPTVEGALGRRLAAPAATSVATLGFGRELDGVRVGIAGKVAEQRLPDVRAAAAAVDVGIAKQVGPVWLGLAAQNVGGALRLGPAGRWQLPRKTTVGAAVDFYPLGPLDVGASAAVAFEEGGEVVPGGGIEIGYSPLEGYSGALRAGVRRVVGDDVGPLSLGAILTRDRFSLEYAYQAIEAPGELHRVGIRFRP